MNNTFNSLEINLYLNSYHYLLFIMNDSNTDTKDDTKECISLISSPILLFVKLSLSPDMSKGMDKENLKWYGKDTKSVDFLTKKKKCIKQMFQQEFAEHAFSPIMYDAKHIDKYEIFLRIVTCPEIQDLPTKEFKSVSWRLWKIIVESMDKQVEVMR